MHSRFKALENYSERELEKLKNSTVAVVGVGATGSVIAENLARHGINLIIIDRDYLEENDLYSSNIYTREDAENARPKAKVCAERLTELTETEFHVADLSSERVEILEEADIILDGTDNLETRLLISEYCRKKNKPWIYTAAVGVKGFSMFFDEECFNCLFNEIKASELETCETAGIMREISSIAASVSSHKAIRYLTGKEVDEELDSIHSGRSFSFDSDGCKACEDGEYERLETSSEMSRICGMEKYQLQTDAGKNALDQLRNHPDTVKENEYLVQLEQSDEKFTVFRSGRVIVEARDEGMARQKVSELLGV